MISAMLQYIQRSPDCFHAVEELRQRLLREGYTELRPGRWQLTAGGKYFTTKNGASMMAFRLPQEAPAGFLLTASHSDSPCFRLRDHAELTGEYIRLSAERYGGMINDSWLDRPLSVAGRVLVRREGGLEARLVDLKRDVALIPRVAIHLNRRPTAGSSTTRPVIWWPCMPPEPAAAASIGRWPERRTAPRRTWQPGIWCCTTTSRGPSGGRRASSCRPPGWTTWPVCLPAPRAF